MWEAAFWGGLSASSLLIGAALAIWCSLPTRVIGLIMAFGVGAMISAISFELIDEALDAASGSGAAGIGLAAGALVFYAGNRYIDSRGGGQRKDIGGEGAEGNASAIVLGTVLDGIPESIVVGGSLVLGGAVSVPMVAAAFLSNLPEAVGATAGLKKGGMSGARLLGLWLAIVFISAASAGLGYAILDDASPWVGAFFQAFAAGAILTMLVDTMIPEAFEEGGKVVGLMTVFGYAIAVYLSHIA
jgi:ZIP family zinc transporter